ncbi:hypothetical protein OQA88_10724 [Cercophora sp. LCS_1]
MASSDKTVGQNMTTSKPADGAAQSPVNGGQPGATKTNVPAKPSPAPAEPKEPGGNTNATTNVAAQESMWKSMAHAGFF